jgi:hypothetical protein
MQLQLLRYCPKLAIAVTIDLHGTKVQISHMIVQDSGGIGMLALLLHHPCQP